MAITGRSVALVALGIVPVLLAPTAATVGLWLVFALLLTALDAALATSPRLVAISRTVPRQVRLAEPADCVLLVQNSARRTLRALIRDAWPPSAGAARDRHRVTIKPGDARRVVTRLRPTRRGDRVADRVTIRSFGPLGLGARQFSLEVPATIRVLPEFRSRRHLPSRLARLREMDGRAAVQVRGQGTEFDSLREYAIGDDVRSIDWRATARAERVVVRTWRPERDRRVLIVVDSSRLAAARVGDEPRLDSSIEAALLLAALASRAGDRVELLVVDRQVRAQVGAVGGAAVLAAFADALAPITPALFETNWALAVTHVRKALSQRALVVLLTPLEPAALEAGLIPVLPGLAKRHQVMVASVADPEEERLREEADDVDAVFDAAAVERIDLERQAAIATIKATGAEVVHAPPERLAPAVADRYLALKAAGKL